MLVYFDKEQNAVAQTMGRYHPWTVTTATPDGRYIDFKANPGEIRTGLEDLRYVEGTAIEDAIVDFIAWANGPASPFETNDFGLRPLRSNGSGVSSKALEQMCRVTVFFRELRRNTLGGDLTPFARRLERALKRIAPQFDQACWGWALWPHLFLALGDEDDPDAEGNVIQLQLWGWGDTAQEVHSNMIRAFAVLRTALEETETGGEAPA
ncbi:glypican family protein [Sphingopyxis indica]|uniref:hypothetical protein n=1 Tax=Sphingopyxis indica TaxID=436663 RepID=UPI0029394F19|nr:hypothetical protein [Sphingopyxis indica]WOF43076.1 glypican family protein [Sphingopyxis indica]